MAGCLLWGRESSWTGCHCWMGTAVGGSSEAGREVVAAAVEEEVEEWV